ncbi:MAG: hypothetical protein AAGK47_04795, partial [Bacteroidota bacterium]
CDVCLCNEQIISWTILAWLFWRVTRQKNASDAAHQRGLFKAVNRQKNKLKCPICFLLITRKWINVQEIKLSLGNG